VILLVLVGIFFLPGTSGSVAQVGIATKPVEVDDCPGSECGRPSTVSQARFKGGTNIIIRNQPHGQIGIKSVKQLPRTVLVPQPDGSLKELPDPRANQRQICF